MGRCDLRELEFMAVVAQKYGSGETGRYMEALLFTLKKLYGKPATPLMSLDGPQGLIWLQRVLLIEHLFLYGSFPSQVRIK